MTLLQRLSLALAVLLAPVPLVAQPVTPALWKVADADTTIYLFGTIHLLPKDIEWYTPQLAQAVDASAELVTEIPEIDPNQTTVAVIKYGMLPPGQSLRALMTKREKVKFAAAMKRLGLPAETFDRFRPWYAAVVMATLPLQRQGYDLQNGVEAQLGERTKARGIARSGLETLDYQLGLFGAFDAKVQKRYLFEVIDSLPTLDKQVQEMVGAWSKGDAPALAAMLNAEQDDPAMLKVLLLDRNKAWAQWIKTRMDRPGTVFIAVGAGHLGGKGSVQDELALAGIPSARVQ
ncbi:MAG: TraB/GumN family protein [Novosphingobium sp.]|uniref:TraB/GumN family protein n=1 Tax=Novosphingobium sp. TaxID=1874826 RepID=UPI0032B74A7E